MPDALGVPTIEKDDQATEDDDSQLEGAGEAEIDGQLDIEGGVTTRACGQKMYFSEKIRSTDSAPPPRTTTAIPIAIARR